MEVDSDFLAFLAPGHFDFNFISPPTDVQTLCLLNSEVTELSFNNLIYCAENFSFSGLAFFNFL